MFSAKLAQNEFKVVDNIPWHVHKTKDMWSVLKKWENNKVLLMTAPNELSVEFMRGAANIQNFNHIDVKEVNVVHLLVNN